MTTTLEELFELFIGGNKKAEVRFVTSDGIDHPIANVEIGDPVLIYETTE